MSDLEVNPGSDSVLLSEEQLLAMPAEDYMSGIQLAFFRQRLLVMKRQLGAHLEQVKQAIAAPRYEADELDRALWEEENRQQMRIAEREFLLLRKVDKALERIDSRDYGYCEASGVEIGLARLLVRPTTEFCTEEKARLEALERNFIKSKF